ncbi:PREDICTED: alpha-glucan water dikinase, chloroplastic-like isoform X1 [Lupinus angustifolius]|uniref:alpha-glucan water dikinase, chloroplastic-like isoform X1 n=1 Tax=Lupinus angustifolius TaxID=3871 RepID=UPI00092F495C|nr:PREDICTED: alpha-glucan water dikinase, chloroplastic-like isoform X1 [Lupinus angustifolius]
MSNSVSHSIFHQTLIYQSKVVNSCGNRLGSKNKFLLSTNFRGNRFCVKKLKEKHQQHRFVNPCAVLTSNAASEDQLSGKFNLEGNLELQVVVNSSAPVAARQVDIQVSNSSGSLVLHWGVVHDRQGWVLPSRSPDGTKVYKNRALRTPFVKSGSGSFLKIEVDDPAAKAIEFLILDESQNKWFKNNGENFHIKLPVKDRLAQQVSVPEDLVQVQAYIRWERKGKQIYTPEQEKEEYEAARRELLEEVTRGTSVQDLRARLTNKTNATEVKEPTVYEPKTIPDELVQIQAFIRWEKAGKPNYSPEQQLMEFEEARKDLLSELEKGASVDEIRKKITKGEIQTKVAKQLNTKEYFNVQRIQRKKRDLTKLINRNVVENIVEQYIESSKTLTIIESYAKAREEYDGSLVLNKKIHKLADGDLLVLVTKDDDKTNIHLATDSKVPVTFHWALTRTPGGGEWLVPPANALPPGSVTMEGAAETPFKAGSSSHLSYEVQTLDIEVKDDTFKGIPFVILSGGKWIKNNGSNFIIEFGGKKQIQKDFGDAKGTAKGLLDKIAEMESEAQKSFMHRFNIASDLIDEAKNAGQLGLAGILVWMRFMATRQLIWNKNYNVKPREISKAQDRLTDLLQDVYTSYPQYRELVRMIMSTVGRGGEGDVGQRIRDEILVIQRNNDLGGMMEEWHQKLHNNTSPDDVVICQALIDYINSDFDIGVYWKTLNDNGITKERLLSYDRAIHSEPNFGRDQKEGLLRDLGNYMKTLKAVHSGADLESAITNCKGYKAEGQGFMVGVNINPVSGLPSGFPELLQFVMENIEDKNAEPLLEGLLEARQELQPSLKMSQSRLKDLLFLDVALDSTVRTAVERGYEQLNNAGPEKIMYFISMVLENLALSSDDNEDLIYCLKGWDIALSMCKSKDTHWALYAKSVLDRTRLALTNKAELYQQILQPSAEYLGSLLGVDRWAIEIFTEEMIRAGSAASLSTLLNRLDPVLRKTANLGSWQVISPVETIGYVEVVDELLTVQNKSYERPTILVAKRVKGEEEIPDGAVAVLTPDMPDVLSHVSVRARNSKVCFATCFDPNILAELQANKGKLLRLKPTSADVVYSEVKESEFIDDKSTHLQEFGSGSPISLVKKQFSGRYAVSSEEFTVEMVGAKSRNISYLKGKVPSWVGIPTSVALPFGVFEHVLSDKSNQAIAEKVNVLKKKLTEGDFSALKEIRETVLQLNAPSQLVEELKVKMKSSGMPWPGDDGEQRWEQAWKAIKKVWGSKWNERAYFSTRKVKLDHDYLSMSVLVQEVINADYAFVIHTTNPSSGDSSEIYAEVVKGLGETLVGAYPGRALSFICKKHDLNSPRVLGYPSKPIGLFIRRSIIFRSDSNGEDLEGYAGAGLYDSVPMDEEDKVVLDYSSDQLIIDGNFRQSILSSIAGAGNAIEELYGSPQDIEGVIRDGKVYVVQTRPQM